MAGFFSASVDDGTIRDLSEEGIDALVEAFAYDEILHMDDEKRKALVEGAENEGVRNLLQEKGMINKTTLVKLSKSADLDRRNQLAVYQLAKEHNDPLWTKFLKFQRGKIATREALNRKYHSKAAIESRKAQKSYIKKNPITSIVIH